jgi:Cu/Ag efflux protein CusF
MRGESISVVHETIPEVMNAMRMSLRIDDPDVAEGLETGDVIRFDMVRTEAGWYARNIEVLPPDTELDLPEDLREVGLP